jgi:hypothetical protein
MTSTLKSAASRVNGAKSKGPITAEGKNQSSRNSLVHGFTAKHIIVLACENEDEFQELLDDYSGAYQPGSAVESGLVEEMVACRWRMQRLRAIETALLDSEMDRAAAETATQVATDDPSHQLAFAFRRLVDESRAISLASRYEARLHRIHERSHQTLRELQQTRREQTAEPASPAPVLPEPVAPTADTPVNQPEKVIADACPSSPPFPEPSQENEKCQNEPTPLPSAAIGKDRRGLSIVGHRGFRRLDIKGFRRFQQRKTA